MKSKPQTFSYGDRIVPAGTGICFCMTKGILPAGGACPANRAHHGRIFRVRLLFGGLWQLFPVIFLFSLYHNDLVYLFTKQTVIAIFAA